MQLEEEKSQQEEDCGDDDNDDIEENDLSDEVKLLSITATGYLNYCLF